MDEEVEDAAPLLSAGGDRGEGPPDGPTAPLAVGAEARLPPAHRVTHRTPRRVRGRLRGVRVEAGFEVREPNFEMADAGFEESDVRLNGRGHGVEDIRR